MRALIRPKVHAQTLLVVSGGGVAWREQGCRLYRDDRTFRDGIDAADARVRADTGLSPSAAFDERWAPASWVENRVGNKIFMGLFNLGIHDALTARGFRAAATLGLSLAETNAAYAAGILSRRDAVTMMTAVAANLEHRDDESIAYFLKTSTADAHSLCQQAPRPLWFSGEGRYGISIVLGDARDAVALGAYLDATGAVVETSTHLGWYHTRDCGFDTATYGQQTAGTAPRIPCIPFYSAARGGQVGDEPLQPDFWAEAASEPYFLGSAAAQAADDGVDMAICVGPPLVARWLADGLRAAGYAIPVIDWLATNRSTRPWRRPEAPVAPKPAINGPIDFSFGDPAIRADPFPMYAALRAAGPVHHMPRDDAWLVIGYEEIQFVLASPDAFSSAPYNNIDATMLAAGPPLHGPIRRIMSRRFSAAEMKRLTDLVGETAETLILPRLDIVGEFAKPITHAIARDLIGPDEAGMRDILIAALPVPNGGNWLNVLSATIERIADRTTLYAELRDAGLDRAQCCSLIQLMWLAAVPTSTRAIAYSVLALLRHDTLQDRLSADPHVLPIFVEEAMRLFPEPMIRRKTTRPVRLGTTDLPAGALVQLSLAAGNRDPAVFDRPAEIVLDVPRPKALTFGAGIHHCLAAPLVRRIVPRAIATLIDAGRLVAMQPLHGRMLGEDMEKGLQRLMIGLVPRT
ncbi:cytochrome P450 [Sphingomonas sp. CROZ-RG-20F-R02-07]|uniref:cytochrome P450 n=1 Tax=Sphingomonas sp. CROZ-RG-20F-R02-07 TaxID=2914832 RepID=UPI001F59D91E|nr:cytochrome P450 [Sphingomonas sp. CROZ-RG-20F-R02-07]